MVVKGVSDVLDLFQKWCEDEILPPVDWEELVAVAHRIIFEGLSEGLLFGSDWSAFIARVETSRIMSYVEGDLDVVVPWE